MRSRFIIILLLAVLFIAVMGLTPVEANASPFELKVLDPPRGPSDLPDPSETTPPRRTGRDLAFRIVLFFVATALFALDLYTLYDPQEAYLLFRRHLKYRSDVELSAAYRSLLRIGAGFSILLFSLILLLLGEGIILLLSWGTLGLSILSSRLFSPLA